jgi:ubiquinone/menaquinone biosynthesis C-methylase UbiE
MEDGLEETALVLHGGEGRLPSPTSANAHAVAAQFFDRIAEDYRLRSQAAVCNVSSLSFRRRQSKVTRMLLLTPVGGTVVDFGMGPAVFATAAASRGLRYVGIDISERMVEMARELQLPNSEFHVGDLQVLERFTGAADTLLLVGLIDYLQDPCAGLRRLARCVKPGGRIIMSFRNHRSLPRALRSVSKCVWRAMRRSREAARTAFEAPVLENSFVPQRDLIPTLREEGFAEPIIEYLDCSPVHFNVSLPRWLWERWLKVDEVLSRRAPTFLCASGVVMAQKH